MKVINLKAENVKRLKAIDITPDGNLIVVGGKNTAGKSSVLDSIYMALSGKKSQGKKPVRIGEEKAVIDCDLGKLMVHRTINADGGGSIKVTNEDGMVYQSPQTILDALSSKLSFDPLAFSKETTKNQTDILKNLVGLDFDDLNKKRKDIYDNRTMLNRELAQEKARISEMTYHDNAPKKETSVSELTRELMEAQAFNRDQEQIADSRREWRDKIDELKSEMTDIQNQIDFYEDKVRSTQAPKDHIDIQPIQDKISNNEYNNKLVQENQRYNELKEKILSTSEQVKLLTHELDEIDANKLKMMEEANMPIDGLSFDDDGVSYNGIPFDQCSSAEQLRVSLAMGMALNPELKVLLIRDGSLLDDDNFQLIREMAEQHDVQVWIERVGEDDECSVIIEDGEVKITVV